MNPDDIVFCYNKDAQNEKSQQKLKRTIATGIAQWNANFVAASRSRLII